MLELGWLCIVLLILRVLRTFILQYLRFPYMSCGSQVHVQACNVVAIMRAQMLVALFGDAQMQFQACNSFETKLA